MTCKKRKNSRRNASVGRLPKSTGTGLGSYIIALKAAHGGAWSSTELCMMMGLKRQELKERRDGFLIAYWTDTNGHCFYPKWQFDADFQVRTEVKTILRMLRSHDTLYVLNQFVAPTIGDEGTSVLELVLQGQGGVAIKHVQDLLNA